MNSGKKGKRFPKDPHSISQQAGRWVRESGVRFKYSNFLLLYIPLIDVYFVSTATSYGLNIINQLIFKLVALKGITET